MNLRKTQLLIFILVPLVNFGVNFFFSSPFDDDLPVLIQPAGYAFAIWGPIFLGMLIYSWFQLKSERVESPHLTSATKAGILAGLASIAFVPISYTDIQWLGFINIIWHLVALIWLFVSLRKQILLEKNKNTHWFYLPTQMYLGWICAATAVSTALMLADAGLILSIETQTIVTVVVIGALVLVGIIMALNKGMTVALVVIWALIGVIVENGDTALIKYAAMVGSTILFLVAMPQIIKRKRLAF